MGRLIFLRLPSAITKKHHSIEPTKCTYCDYVCKYNDRLKRHIQQIHLKDKIKCKYCSAEFSEKRKLNSHLKVSHQENTDFQCKVCDKSFNSNVLRWNHIRTVHDPPRYKCPHCPQKYTSSQNLKKHKCITGFIITSFN